VATPTLLDVVEALDRLRINFWRWPGGHLGLWPPPLGPLRAAVRDYKQPLLDLADARGREPPDWARTPDGEGWYSPPEGDERVRFGPGACCELALKPEAVAALDARLAAYTDAEWAALVEGILTDDAEPWEV